MGVSAEWRELLADKGVMENSYEDLCSMHARTETYCGFTALAGAYDSLLFEAGQGLRLDEMNRADFPYLTPSRTVSLVSAKRIAALGEETEATVLYVTRAYLTRHGAGPLPGECDKARINPDMTDRTNVPNPHQQVLRYGMLDTADLLRYTNDDLAESRSILPGLKSAVAVTHLNETDGQLAGDGDLKELCSHFDESYLSFGPCELKRAEG